MPARGLPWIHRVFALHEALGARHLSWLRRKHIDTYLNEFVFRYNRRFYRHVSFETMLGLGRAPSPMSYWGLSAATIPAKACRQSGASRAAGQRTRMAGSRSRPPKKVEPSPVSIRPATLDIDQPGTTGMASFFRSNAIFVRRAILRATCSDCAVPRWVSSSHQPTTLGNAFDKQVGVTHLFSRKPT